ASRCAEDAITAASRRSRTAAHGLASDRSRAAPPMFTRLTRRPKAAIRKRAGEQRGAHSATAKRPRACPVPAGTPARKDARERAYRDVFTAVPDGTGHERGRVRLRSHSVASGEILDLLELALVERLQISLLARHQTLLEQPL